MNELCRNNYGSTENLVVYDSKAGFRRRIAGGCLSASCCWYAKKGSTYAFYFPLTSKRFRNYESCYWCLFSEEEITEYLEDINRFIETPITWEFESMSDGKVLRLVIHVPEEYNERQCLYILTRIRQLAEIPFALYLKDAMKLWRTRDEMGWDSIEHCLWRVLVCQPETAIGDGGFFCSYSRPPFYPSNRCSLLGHKTPHGSDSKNTYTEWEGLEVYKERLKNIHQSEYYYTKLFKKGNYETNKLTWSDHFFDLDFWLKGFELRLPVYLGKTENLPNIKEVPRYPDSEIYFSEKGTVENYVLMIKNKEGIL